MKIDHQTDHEDGSATFQINISDEEQITLVQEGLLSLIRKGIAEVAAYQNEYPQDQHPDAWMVGEHVFKHRHQAEAFHNKFSHSGIIPLFKHV